MKNCSTGVRCKGTCIYRNDNCRAEFSAKASLATTQAKSKIIGLAKENHVDAQIGVVSTGAAILGGSVGGPIGAKVAELAASLAVRKGNQDFKATKRAYDKVKVEARYKEATRLDKSKMVLQQAVLNLKENRRERKLDLISEGTGFFVGNAAALIPVPVPLRGMVAAIVTTPRIMSIADPFIK